jgi:PhnB protein
MKINPYLHFNGRCEEAFKFYAQTFGGTIDVMMPHGGTPSEAHVAADWRDKIMHAQLSIGDQVLMGTDVPPAMGGAHPQSFAVSLQVDTPADAERVFGALMSEGSVMLPIQQTFWSARFGMGTDRYGIPWMVNCTQQPVE